MKITTSTVSLITGGSSGIGKTCAERILSRGGIVVSVDYNAKAGQDVVNQWQKQYGQDRAEFLHCDVSDSNALDRVFKHVVAKYKRLDIVFNNAGIGERTMWHEAVGNDNAAMPKDWFDVLNIDLHAVINGTRLAVREMLKLNENGNAKNTIGVIVNTASVGGLHPMPFSPIYCAAKHGVVGFSRSCKILRQNGIRVVAICPSFADTALVRKGMKDSDSYREYMDNIQKMTGPLLHVDEVANGFIEAIDNDKYAGSIISISQELGIAQHFAVPMKDQPVHVTKTIMNREQNQRSKL